SHSSIASLPNLPLEITLLSAVDLPQIAYSWASRKGFETDITGGGKRMVFRYLPSEEDRGGIQFNAAFLRFNQLRQFNQRFYLGWDNKKLQIDYATFRDKLRPGAPEEWTLTVKNADGSPIAAAALASMYDASLDQIYRGRNWSLNPFPNFGIYRNFASLVASGLQNAYGRWNQPSPEIITPEGIPSLDLGPFPWDGYGGGLYPQSYSAPTIRRRIAGAPGDGAAMTMRAAPAPAMAESKASVAFSDEVDSIIIVDPEGELAADQPAADTPVQIRKNLQETAFWMPTLTSNAAGELKISFTSPEALTSWNLRVLAHDKDLNAGVSTQTVLTQKELIVLPNVPRFVREGDAIELTARVNNLTEEAMLVKARVEFFDPATNEPLALGAAAGAGACVEEQSIAANSGASFCFPISIPEGLSSDGPIGYRIVARGGDFSDGEENIIPVLTDRTLVTVSQPFYLKRKQKKSVTLPVLASNNSATLRHVGYTFQATTNSAWLALKALPYLMEYPYDCTEQLANRYFANQLAFATVSRKPVLEEVFRQWQADTNALKSELERNPTLKNALLTETPWLRAAQSEAEQRARISNLFDLKKLADEQVTALEKLANRQDPNGHFSWFPGGRENRYMTQYVLETMGRMQQLGVVTPDQAARVSGISSAAINWLDQQMTDDYRRLQEQMKDQKNWQKDYRPSSTVVHYLYARSQSSGDLNPDRAVGEALAFFEERAKAKWLDYDLYEQVLIAITYATPQQASRPQSEVTQKIITSLRERAIRKDEFGMYWKYGRGYRWQNLPIETHCRILEAFQAAGGTTEELDEMRLWLLTNKRTNRWPTTKSTAAAVYALLNAGTDWTKTDGKPLKVSWPGLAKKNGLSTRVGAAQNSAEAATGAFSVSAQAGEITADLATVQVKNRENELVWGGVYWQYTELAQKVEASTGGPLSLERELFHRIPTEDGMRLEPITADKPLSAGDRVTVRLILRSDRDLDFVHLKDRRAATFEPIEQLSGYQYKNGLGYYFAPGDLATNFFVDHLPKGTYTLEYDLFATYSGSFSNGLGRVQSMYAPEFGANTAGARIVVE
ncbi:MAG: alpha-2-macroglobulin family protein, partial [Bacteroidota bacterium]